MFRLKMIYVFTNPEPLEFLASNFKGKAAARNVLGGLYQPGKALSIPDIKPIMFRYNLYILYLYNLL